MPPSKVYPRVCGGNSFTPRPLGRCQGLSPRVRGKPASPSPPSPSWRSIPACAGETYCCAAACVRDGVYPRVCGGNLGIGVVQPIVPGLSPRVRGKRVRLAVRGGAGRSIPACAGETRLLILMDGVDGVYPRVCGGNRAIRSLRTQRKGLSPRVRGKLCLFQRFSQIPRSIPACAGETRAASSAATLSAVYPRVCGGNGRPFFNVVDIAGLSPRVRGKPRQKPPATNSRRSIPACAGETCR